MSNPEEAKCTQEEHQKSLNKQKAEEFLELVGMLKTFAQQSGTPQLELNVSHNPSHNPILASEIYFAAKITV
mgnify:CR=1 FL=1